MRAQDQVVVVHLRGIERRFKQARLALQLRQAGIDIENDALKLDDKTALAEPPEHGSVAVRRVDVGKQVAPTLYRFCSFIHSEAARSSRSRTPAQITPPGGR